MKKAVIICGPTASGKTNFAHKYALINEGEIVNGDSMQIYKQLSIITASPAFHLTQELPYHLYNFLDISEEFSAAKYAVLASRAVEEISSKGKLPIIVGGSGMYINMLTLGFSSIPTINQDVRDSARRLYASIGSEGFYKLLSALDPKAASLLNSNDSQRVIRAYEVIKQTGKSILDFQNEGNIIPLPNYEFDIILLMPGRSFLYETCDNRFIELAKHGGLKEVEKIYRQFFERNELSLLEKLPALKALGVAEFIAHIKGDISLEKAIELASAKTRQYAKRQCTWFNNKIKEKQVISFNNFDEYSAFTKGFLLS